MTKRSRRYFLRDKPRSNKEWSIAFMRKSYGQAMNLKLEYAEVELKIEKIK